MTALFVAVAGGLGALARFELGRWISARTPGHFPAGTLAVNTTGTLLLAMTVSLGMDAPAGPIIQTGFLGGFTTFSTWMVETVSMRRGAVPVRWPILNLGLMFAGGYLGWWLGSAVAGA